MTRRERLERRAERRDEWAHKADIRSGAAFERGHQATAGIPPGQPILIGHHSEKRHRRALARQDAGLRNGFEEKDKASHHRSKASGLRHQLATTIYSDDPDAVEALRAKVEKLETQRERARKVNAAWRKAKKPDADDAEGWQKVAAILGVDLATLTEARKNQAADFLPRGPYPPYVLQNLGSRIKAAKERIRTIEYRQQKADQAEAAGGVLIDHHTGNAKGWSTVTFAERPDRSTIDGLKAAGYRWGNGHWFGKTDQLPEGLKGGAS